MSRYRRAFIGLIFLLVVGVGVWTTYDVLTVSKTEEDIEKAYLMYRIGEEAETVEARRRAFNEALGLYAGLEARYRPYYGSGVLYYNLANTYFQLGEYPWAVLYYSRAQSLMPRHREVANNLEIALRKVRQERKIERSPFENLFFFHYHFSLPERLQLLSLFLVLTFACLVSDVWRRRWRKGAVLFGVVSVLMFLSVCYTQYLEPVTAVLVRSSLLYRGPGNGYAPVSEDPAVAGVTVEVIDAVQEGQWLQVLTNEGTLGFVPAAAARVI